MKAEVIPCPFCGGTELDLVTSTTDREGTPIHLSCAECGVGGPWHYCPSKDYDTQYAAALVYWNKRK